jgi:septum site-determining protein MinC
LTGEVVVKGWRNGLLLILPPEGGWDDVIEQVHAKLDEAKARSFWRGSQATIDLGTRAATHSELEALLDRLKRGFGLVPVAVVAEDPATREAGEKLALVSYAEMPVVRKPTPREPREANGAGGGESAAAPVAAASPANNALYVPGTVRSGQRIVHEGHLVIVGDVNAGAEVLAEGDVVVFGALRGLAHAGYNGNEAARIVAGSLRPPQLRIAGKIARSPEEEGVRPAAPRTPEVARIENGEIQVSPL